MNIDSNVFDSGRRRISNTVKAGILSLLFIHPLIYHDRYFDIMRVKFITYVGIISVMIAAVFMLSIVWLFTDFKYNNSNKRIRILRCLKLRISSPADFAFLIFFIITVLSSLQSDHTRETLLASGARYGGVITILIYLLGYFLITRWLDFDQGVMDAFLLSCIIVSTLGILDYFKIDVLHLKFGMEMIAREGFTSTIGNINSYAILIGMAVAIAVTMFIIETDTSKIFIYYGEMVVLFLASALSRSDSIFLVYGTLFTLLPLFIFDSRIKIQRYIASLTSLFASLCLVKIISNQFSERIYEANGILKMIIQSNIIFYLFCAALIITLILICCFHSSRSFTRFGGKAFRYFRVIWFSAIALGSLASVFVIFDINVLGNITHYGPIGQLLHISDDWGTGRGLIWRISIEDFRQFSPLRKLFGYGPDTFGILTQTYNSSAIAERGFAIDNAHNEYLQYLVTHGVFGLLSYLSILITFTIQLCRNIRKNPLLLAPLLAVLCYAVQAVINIAQPTTTPIMMTILAVGMAWQADESQ